MLSPLTLLPAFLLFFAHMAIFTYYHYKVILILLCLLLTSFPPSLPCLLVSQAARCFLPCFVPSFFSFLCGFFPPLWPLPHPPLLYFCSCSSPSRYKCKKKECCVTPAFFLSQNEINLSALHFSFPPYLNPEPALPLLL